MNHFSYPDTNFESPIIVALDYNNEANALAIIKQLDPSLCKLKVGKELFVATGPRFIEKLVAGGYKVFLDLKFHDIPNTVYNACKAANNLGIWMINVHASGGKEMLLAARNSIDEYNNNNKPFLIAVTILTSMIQTDLDDIKIKKDITEHTIDLAQLSFKCGLDGVVCSALEANKIKKITDKKFLTVNPGIRLTESKVDDQKRIMTPENAFKNGADYLVIGRPITQATNPREKLEEILSAYNYYRV